jgi:hypothetical protein
VRRAVYGVRIVGTAALLEIGSHLLYFTALARTGMWRRLHEAAGIRFGQGDLLLTVFWVATLAWLKVPPSHPLLVGGERRLLEENQTTRGGRGGVGRGRRRFTRVKIWVWTRRFGYLLQKEDVAAAKRPSSHFFRRKARGARVRRAFEGPGLVFVGGSHGESEGARGVVARAEWVVGRAAWVDGRAASVDGRAAWADRRSIWVEDHMGHMLVGSDGEKEGRSFW